MQDKKDINEMDHCISLTDAVFSPLTVAARKPCIMDGGSPSEHIDMQRVTGAFFTLHPMLLVAHFRYHIGDVKYATSSGVLELNSPVLRVYEDHAATVIFPSFSQRFIAVVLQMILLLFFSKQPNLNHEY